MQSNNEVYESKKMVCDLSTELDKEESLIQETATAEVGKLQKNVLHQPDFLFKRASAPKVQDRYEHLDFRFVPTEKCTLDDVDAAFDRDEDLLKYNPLSRFRSDITSTNVSQDASHHTNKSRCRDDIDNYGVEINEDMINHFLKQL
jgi:hypothetical protein